MIFKTLEIQNFMSIQHAKLDLENQGLTLITGENLDNPNFTNNGAGKSTIIEALTYVLYGKTIRGLRGDAVVNLQISKNCKVTLDIYDEETNSEYRITRYRKHAQHNNEFFLFKNKKDITPKSVDVFTAVISEIMQMDYKIFISSIMYSAMSFNFTSATDSELKSMFDTMLGLDLYTHCLDKVKADEKSLNANTLSLESKLETAKVEQKNLEDKIQEYKELSATHEQEQKDARKSLQADIKEELKSKGSLDSDLEDLNTLIEDVKTDMQALETKSSDKKLKKLTALQEELTETLHSTESHISELTTSLNKSHKQTLQFESDIKYFDTQIETWEHAIGKLNIKISKLKGTVGQTCPTCGNTITAKSTKNVSLEYKQEIEELETKIQETLHEITSAKQGMQAVKEKTIEITEEKDSAVESLEETRELLKKLDSKIKSKSQQKLQYQKLDSQLDSYKYKQKTLQKQIEKTLTNIESLQKQLTKLKKSENPFISKLQVSEESLKKELQVIRDYENELSLLYRKQTVIAFWLQAFGNAGIKSYLLDNVTPFLTARANKYLLQLSSDHMDIEFSTQSQLKSGDKKEKFNIIVHNKDGGDNYIANSSGEKRRIDIAVNLAIQDLLATRSAKKLNLAFYDEVFDTLDESGVENVIQLLTQVSQEKSSVFVITHSESLKQLITNTITVVKKDGLSTLKGA